MLHQLPPSFSYQFIVVDAKQFVNLGQQPMPLQKRANRSNSFPVCEKQGSKPPRQIVISEEMPFHREGQIVNGAPAALRVSPTRS
ncbi:MAG: hypothetical protein IJB81_11150 [Clostridia bacterium]|nr:hypothetical protein [Clostridia bacterium]